jgi:transposase
MDSKFYLYNRSMMMIMPPTIQEWLPEKHLAKFVVDIVDELDVSDLEKKYAQDGGKAYPVKIMLGLLFYGYITGTYSSRKIEKATHDSVAFRFIAANLHPDHGTISLFRKNFSGMLDNIFLQILLIASESGFLKLGNVSVDGTKIKANASKHKALSWKYANQLEGRLKKEIKELMQKANEIDNKEEDEKLDIPVELERRENRLSVIRRAKEEIKKRAQERGKREEQEYSEAMKRRASKEAAGIKCKGKLPNKPCYEPKDKDQVNLVDEESRIMPQSGSKDFLQAYNAHATVDQNTMLVVANHVTQHANDKQEIEPTLNHLKKTENALQQRCKTLSADAGFFSKDNVKLCESANIVPLIVDKRDKHNTWLDQQKGLSSESIYDDEIVSNDNSVIKMKKRMQTKEGKEIYAKRKSTVETAFGNIKSTMGFRGFLRRSLKAATEEWNLVSIAWNIKRLFALTLSSCQNRNC